MLDLRTRLKLSQILKTLICSTILVVSWDYREGVQEGDMHAFCSAWCKRGVNVERVWSGRGGRGGRGNKG
jgi:hypothetical protein